MGTMDDVWSAEAFLKDQPKHKVLAEKTYTAKSGKTAAAIIEALVDAKTDEILNADIVVKKSVGDIVYLPKDYQEAREWAKQLVEHWDSGDLLWEPDIGNFNGAPASESGLIPLAEYAIMHGKAPISAQQKARRGGFRTAQKLGRDWVINAAEPYDDNRKGKKMTKEEQSIYALGKVYALAEKALPKVFDRPTKQKLASQAPLKSLPEIMRLLAANKALTPELDDQFREILSKADIIPEYISLPQQSSWWSGYYSAHSS